jgi:phosphatidate cytidylyltransferase
VSSGRFWPRLATFLVGLSVFYALIFLLPHLHHLAFNVLAVAATVLGGLELARLLAGKGLPAARAVSWLGALLPAGAWLELEGRLPAGSLWAGLLILAGGALAATVWARSQEQLGPMLPRAAASLLQVLYPGLFMAFVVRLSGLPRADLALGFFFCLVFVNDTLAYLGGVLSRGWSRLGWPVSPNKSAIGFGCGLAGAAGTAALCRALFPAFLPVGYPAAVAFGLAIGVLTILGDLVESALKRSSGVKDSSSLIPGRGGVLDSVDSWLLAAPAYYLFFRYIGTLSQS